MSHTNSTPNYSLPQFLSSDKPAWMADINAAMSAIDTGMKTNADAAAAAQSTADKAVLNGAPGYSNLSTYDVDDVVNYQGRVYKCIIAVVTPEAFDNAKWILYDLQDASKAIDDIDLELGSADISGIGDGTVKGAINAINSNLSVEIDHASNNIAWSTQLSYLETVYDGLSAADKRRAIITNGAGLVVRVSDITNALFNGVSVVDDTQAILYTFNLRTHKAYSITITANNVSFNVISTNINANMMYLYLV